MWSGKFDPKEREVWVRARVHGPLGFWDVDAMLDIGTSTTIISAAVLDSLRYGAHMGKVIRHIVGWVPAASGFPATTWTFAWR